MVSVCSQPAVQKLYTEILNYFYNNQADSSNFNQTDEYFQWSASILLAANKSLTLQSTLVNVSLQNIKVGEEQDYLSAYYSLTLSDNIDFSPFEQWKSMGKPVQPSLDQLQTLLKSSSIEQSSVKSIKKSTKVLHLLIKYPSIKLVQLCSPNPNRIPPPPYSVRYNVWNSVSNITAAMITWAWKADTSCLETFILQLYSESSSSWTRVEKTNYPIRELAATLLNPEPGSYRVIAQDIWRRQSKPSGWFNIT